MHRDRTGAIVQEGITIDGFFRDMLDWCELNGVPFVVAAGNDDNAWYQNGVGVVGMLGTANPPPVGAVPCTLDLTTPQLHAPNYRPLITVGGVNNNGSLWPYTTPRDSRPGKSGYIDTYAQAGEVTVALANSQSTVVDSGTSFSAAAVVRPRLQVRFCIGLLWLMSSIVWSYCIPPISRSYPPRVACALELA